MRDVKLDTIIRVDRSARLVYPNWVIKVMHPKLEAAGPAEYDLGQVEQFLHEQQKEGLVEGNELYEFFKDSNLLAKCLGLADLLAIQAKEIDFFQKYFYDKWVFGWRSVVQHNCGRFRVSSLDGHDGEVKLHWYWLVSGWHALGPALLFKE